MPTIIFVILCIFSVFLVYLADKKNSRLLFLLAFLIPALLAGFRGIEVGIDTKFYYTMINTIHAQEEVYVNERGFVLLVELLTKINSHPGFVLCIISIATIGLFYLRFWELRKDHSLTFMCVIFLCMFYLRSMNVVRQFMAWALVFWGMRFLDKKRYIIFSLLVVFTMYFFHTTAIFAIGIMVFYLIKDFKKSKKAKIILIAMVAAVAIASRWIISYLSNTYDVYLFLGSFEIGFLDFYRLISLIVVIALFGMGVVDGKFDNKLKFYSILYVIAILLDFISYFGSYIGRIALYFMSFEILFYGRALKQSKKKFLLVVVGMILFGYMAFQYVTADGFGIFPYEFLSPSITEMQG